MASAGAQVGAQCPGLGLSLMPPSCPASGCSGGTGPRLGGPSGHHGQPPSLREWPALPTPWQVLLTADAGAAVVLANKQTWV